jgi:hypothetical protein
MNFISKFEKFKWRVYVEVSIVCRLTLGISFYDLVLARMEKKTLKKANSTS